MAVPGRALLIIGGARPVTGLQRPERKMLQDVPQGLVTGVAKVDAVLPPTAFGNRDAPGVGLQVPERAPASRGIAHARPERPDHEAPVTPRQRPRRRRR